jgi:hypothetical protein
MLLKMIILLKNSEEVEEDETKELFKILMWRIG